MAPLLAWACQLADGLQDTLRRQLEKHPNADVIFEAWNGCDDARVYFLIDSGLWVGFALVRRLDINRQLLWRIELFETTVRGRGHGSTMFRMLMQELGVILPWQPNTMQFWLKMFDQAGTDMLKVVAAFLGPHVTVDQVCRFCACFLSWTTEQVNVALKHWWEGKSAASC